MTRLPLLDPHAQAASRITGQGYIILPAIAPVDVRVIETADCRDGVELCTEYTSGRSARSIQSPFPPAGDVFFVGEAWSPSDPAHPMYGAPRYRAAGESPTGGRWQPGRTLREHMARTRFRVLSRAALRLGEVEEEQAQQMGIEQSAPIDRRPIYYGAPDGTEWRVGSTEALSMFREWYPLWTRTCYDPESWAFLAHMERIP